MIITKPPTSLHPKELDNQRSLIMINAVPIISASASVLNSAFKVTGLAFQLHGVPDEIRHALELINGVEGDINDARRFLRENEETVDDQLRKRVNKAIDAAERARIAIGKTVEACRVDMDGAEDNASSSSTHRRKKTVAIHHRLTWVLRDRESFKSKERNLEYAHSALLACISEMNLLAKLLPQQPQPASSKSDPEDPILRDFLSNSKAQTSKVFFDLEETLGMYPLLYYVTLMLTL